MSESNRPSIQANTTMETNQMENSSSGQYQLDAASKNVLQHALRDAIDMNEREATQSLAIIEMPFGKHAGKQLGQISLRYLDETVCIMPQTWFVRKVIRFVDLVVDLENAPTGASRAPEESFEQLLQYWRELRHAARKNSDTAAAAGTLAPHGHTIRPTNPS